MQIVASIQYDRFRVIGRGQHMKSWVYFATDPQLGGDLAVKEIEKARFGNDVGAYFAEAKATFAAGHQNVVEVRYACQTEAEICLAMRYYPKGSLARLIDDRPLPLTDVLRVAQGVLGGLAHIHTIGYLHLDIKPENILFSETGVPMIADFGQARRTTETGIVAVSGIDAWLVPPETIASGKASVMSDVYQAGLLLYSMANGEDYCKGHRPAVADARERIKRGKFPDRRSFMPHVPRRLPTIIRKALDVSPARRYRSATEMADALCRVRIKRGWHSVPIEGGGRRWTASREGHADLVVEQVPHGCLFNVRTYTERPGEPRRAKGRSANWRDRISGADAMAHLKVVFERLSG